jgi:hypothetical protein
LRVPGAYYGLLRFALGRKWYKGDFRYTIYRLATDLGYEFSAGYGYEEG